MFYIIPELNCKTQFKEKISNPGKGNNSSLQLQEATRQDRG